MVNKYTIGLDVGTSGSKAVLYDINGKAHYSSYAGYNLVSVSEGMAELDSCLVWEKIQGLIRQLTNKVPAQEIEAICVSSLGEAMVPVTEDRKILANSILNMDSRGHEYLTSLSQGIGSEKLYQLAGDQLSNSFSLTKLMWIKNYAPEVYRAADKFLPWNGFIPFMLGGEACVDSSQASRTLMVDLDRNKWSERIIKAAGIDERKLPSIHPTGTIIGNVNPRVCDSLGLEANTKIVLGPHDQVANAVGCGITTPGQAMISMGSFFCIVPLFISRPQPKETYRYCINTEPYVLPDSFVSVIYNQGGLLFKWFRDTFDVSFGQDSSKSDRFGMLEKEIPASPSNILVLPSFSPIGSPHNIQTPNGVITGLSLTSRRGDILKGIFQGVIFYLYDRIRNLPEIGITTDRYVAVGGGSRSDAWVQIFSDVLGAEVQKPVIIESATLGDSIISWVSLGEYSSYLDACQNIIKIEKKYSPNMRFNLQYMELFEKYIGLWKREFQPVSEHQG